MSSEYKVNWFNDFIGVAYRYYEIRMNVVPLFSDLKVARKFWMDTIIGGTIILLKLDS